MRKLIIHLFSLCIICLSCQDKVALYAGYVLSEDSIPIRDVNVNIIKDGKLIVPKEKYGKDINQNIIYTDSIGYFEVGFWERYLINEPNIVLQLSKDGFKTQKIKVSYEADIDNLIILEKE
jgi:hypothetical protein